MGQAVGSEPKGKSHGARVWVEREYHNWLMLSALEARGDRQDTPLVIRYQHEWIVLKFMRWKATPPKWLVILMNLPPMTQWGLVTYIKIEV